MTNTKAVDKGPIFACAINRLPVELLSYIFKIGEESDSPPDREPTPTDGASPQDPPPPDLPFQVLVSHVCVHWRTVALATPALWTEVYVRYTKRPPFDQAAAWLSRSQNLPIDVAIETTPLPDASLDVDGSGPAPMSDADLTAVLALLAPHIARWRAFELHVACYHQLETCFLPVLSVPPLPVPVQLEVLVVAVAVSRDGVQQHFPPITFFGGVLPRMKAFTAIGVDVEWGQDWLVGGASLRSIDLVNHRAKTRPSWNAFARILSASPVETLRVYDSGPQWCRPGTDGAGEASYGIVELPSLKVMELGCLSLGRVTGLLSRLATPSLKSLKLHLNEEDFTDLVHQLVAPTTRLPPPPPRSSPLCALWSLEDLTLCELQCDSHCAALLYRELRSIRRITLHMGALGLEFFQLVGCGGERSTWLPTLQTLRTSGITGEMMRAVVAIRRRNGYPLRAVYMEIGARVRGEDEEWLRGDLERFAFVSAYELAVGGIE
ncbi:hypothetical protein BV22DRAFT_1198536 [Leucogyrophana mollusca]|uniref:Uncharacterized protein n=1 Tax=Leucogyrophana mollusca TaxID=85980 RepID=A0ACB8B6Z8_9AGAM|nr:hypothetical protein BV22DRAFT_1198536 [Leucogyrophana mollusca]